MIGKWHGKLTLSPTEAGGGEWQFVWHGTATFDSEAWTSQTVLKIRLDIPLKEEGHGTGSLPGCNAGWCSPSAPPDLSTWKVR